MRTGGILTRTAALGCLIAAAVFLSACAPEVQRFEPTLAEVAQSSDATVAVAAVPKSLVTLKAKKTAPVPRPVVRHESGTASDAGPSLAERRAIVKAALEKFKREIGPAPY